MTNLMHEICPYRIGSRVRVKPVHPFGGEWRGNYAVVMIEWRYQEGLGHEINIGIASDEDIEARNGYTDGWLVDDLVPITTDSSTTREKEVIDVDR